MCSWPEVFPWECEDGEVGIVIQAFKKCVGLLFGQSKAPDGIWFVFESAFETCVVNKRVVLCCDRHLLEGFGNRGGFLLNADGHEKIDMRLIFCGVFENLASGQSIEGNEIVFKMASSLCQGCVFGFTDDRGDLS